MEGGGFDEVVDGFGLGEVEASGEEGALRELAGFGKAGAVADAGAENVIEQNGGAVGGDFYDVFAGVGIGCLKPGHDSFVEDCPAFCVQDFGETGLSGRERITELQKRFGDAASLWAGETDDANASASGWSGDGCDGVGLEVGRDDEISLDNPSSGHTS